jgi:hypothetical protein
VAYPGSFSGGLQQIQLRTEDRENEDLGSGSPLVRGSGGSYNFVQEISFHIVKIFLIFGTLKLRISAQLRQNFEISRGGS